MPTRRPRIICHAIDYGATNAGSFIPLLTSLSRALTSRGDRFVVLATEVPGATWPAQLADAGAWLSFVRNKHDLVKHLRTLRPDVVHCHFTRFDLPALACGSRVLWHIHSHREARSVLSKTKAFVKYRVLGNNVATFVAVSEAMRNEAIEWFTPRDRTHVIHNGIDTEHFRPPTPEERSSARREFGIAADDRVVLFFDRVPYKGGRVVREALAHNRSRRLLVAGGTAADRERFRSLPHAIALERVADSRRLYWAADALAFASYREAFGLVLVEALACGLPIAATSIPVVAEICDGLDCVVTFPPGDARALAAALEQLPLRNRSNAGRRRAIERFSLARWTADAIRLYDEMG